MIVVGLSGYARAGKDEAANALERQLGFRIIGYADALRAGALNINPVIGWDKITDAPLRLADAWGQIGYEATKDRFPLARDFLQKYGTGGARDIFGEDIWVDTLFSRAEAQGIERLVIPDVRFPNEVMAIMDRSGLVFRIERPGVGPVNDHVSEALTLDDFDPSAVIWNNDTVEALHRSIVRRVLVAFEL